ncbi:DnaJ-domain-containing protein [Xylariaceae sp. FL0662B]|nr:DnaJ-domain-containing protein [Xylariaceae sp. FL0662B]
MENSDLLTYAREFAKTQDLYALLGVEADTSSKDIHRAWRKSSLKYHPDKAGTNPEAEEKWHLFEHARDVLMDAAARELYDKERSAALLRDQQRRAMDAKRRQMVEDLEARERGVKRPRAGADQAKNAMSDTERRRLAEAGRRRMEERQRLMREAEERERERQRTNREQQQEEQEAGRQKKKKTEPRRTPDVGSAESKIDIEPDAAADQGDAYDDRIADIERRLQEARQRKAAKKARKSGVVPEASNGVETPEEVQATTPTKHPGASELNADEKKGTNKSFSFSAPSNPATSATAAPPAAGAPRAKGDFSSTMARLRAAQAAKEARKKAEEAAAAAAATAAAGGQ